MTETVSKNSQQWTGDAVTTAFQMSNVNVQDESHLAVYLGDTLQTITTDYTVGIASEIATVTFLVAPDTDVRVTVVREEPLEQNTDLTTINTFRAEGFEGALDSIVRQIYRLWHKVTRSLTLPDSNVDGSGQFDARSNRVGNVADPTADQDVITLSFAENRYSLQSAGGGDMFKAIYDPDADGKVVSAVNADIAPWSGLTGVPVSFTPSAHTHAYSEISDPPTIPTVSDAAYGASWNGSSDAPTKNSVWTKIEALVLGGGSGDMVKSTYDTDDDGKVNSAVSADVAPWSGITDKPATFTPNSHNHTASEITDFNTTADGRISAAVGVSVQAHDAALVSLAGLSLTAGDILYATAADTLVRLPKGTALQTLRMNSGATAPEWAAASGGGASFSRIVDEVTLSGAAYTLGSFDYDEAYIFIANTQPSGTNAALRLRFSDDGGTTDETTNYINFDTSETGFSSLYDLNAWDNGTNRGFAIHILRVGNQMYVESKFSNDNFYASVFDNGNAVDSLKIYPDAGTFSSGSITVWAK